MTLPCVGDLCESLEIRYPLHAAEAWDRNGLLVGDASQTISGVNIALDVTADALRACVQNGANVLLTHHPVFLEAPGRFTAQGQGALAYEAAARGIALVNAHTNLDNSENAQRLIPQILGLSHLGPLVESYDSRMLVTVWAPEEAAASITQAMHSAGAGEIGSYESCSFASEGSATFTAPRGANPSVGVAGERTLAREARIEVVCDAALAAEVMRAAREAHPYETPLITAAIAAMTHRAHASGALAVSSDGALSVGGLAARAAHAFGSGVNVWGDISASIELVATSTGSGGSFIEAAVGARAQAFVTGEVRYHDALAAAEQGLVIIELGHDVSEWPLTALLADVALSVPGVSPGSVSILERRYAATHVVPEKGF